MMTTMMTTMMMTEVGEVHDANGQDGVNTLVEHARGLASSNKSVVEIPSEGTCGFL